jgi:capsular polysaccharide biosynthesis protein
MSKNKNLVGFLKVVLKWRKFILIVTVIAMVGSIIIALLQPDYYKSTAIFYPKNLGSFDRSYLFGNGERDKIQPIFGGKQDVNRVLSIANSTELINEVINKFDIADHYNYDTTKPNWRYRVYKEFDKNYKTLKSDLDDIELSVWDQDPELASEIANYFVYKINLIYSSILMDRNKNNAKSIEDRVIEFEKELEFVTDSLLKMNDPENPKYKALLQVQENLIEEYNNWQTLSNQYKAASDYEYKALYIVEQAHPAEKKDRPVRWIIVLSATLITFFLTLLAALLFEKYKEIREDL